MDHLVSVKKIYCQKYLCSVEDRAFSGEPPVATGVHKMKKQVSSREELHDVEEIVLRLKCTQDPSQENVVTSFSQAPR